MLLAPMAVVLALTSLYLRFDQVPMVNGALRNLGAVAAGLVLSTGLKLFGSLQRNVMGLPVCIGVGVATFMATAWLRLRLRLRLPLVWALAVLGSFAVLIAWIGLRAR